MTQPALTLYPYQQRWLADHSRFKVGMFARQTGKTFTTTLEIVLDCLDRCGIARQTHALGHPVTW